ncbi:hypothetical protein CHS0354_036514 [Potamilus streckersoni]|uniref:THO complex subunit 5 n=1 Tax=Potamilus streckersoni TaxID=2493646 RepID=A0AAE0S981_9BIVA|nr:hypothetical protein CHS0354_036514 [Potamilus streckersoni]
MSSKDVPLDKEKKRKRTLKAESLQNGSGDGKLAETKRIKPEPGLKQESGVSLFYAEEEEVDERDPEKDVEQFKAACANIKHAILDIRQLKENKASQMTDDIERKRVEATLQFIALKKLNRLAHIRCKKVRDSTNEAKLRIDKYHLQLQNLLYEVMHLEKEITKCLEFKSKDEEIELVSLDQFYSKAPAEISKPEVTQHDQHQQTLARLDWELEQRKQLASRLKVSQESKTNVEEDIRIKQEYLENLQPKLNTILQATKPVQEYLGMPFDEIREQHQTAGYLPPPLFVLYKQATAYREACDNLLTVTLDGDLDAARLVDLSVPLLDEDSESDQEEQEKKASKRRRKTVDAKLSDKKHRVLKKHPLSVVIQVGCEDESALQLTFSYLMYLHIVTVTIKVRQSSEMGTSSVSGGDLLSEDTLLDELYPGDHGDTTPNPTNQYQLTRSGLKDFNHYIPQVGQPYRWAQWICGLQYLGEGVPQKPQEIISCGSLQGTIRKIRQRFKARISLLQQLSALERHTVAVAGEYQSLFPVKLQSQVVIWQRSTFEDFVAAPYTRSIVEAGLAKDNDMFFIAVIERGTAKLTARIVVAPDYPNVAPIFSVLVQWQSERCSANDSHIKNLEEELNVHYEELVQEKSCDYLLTNQMQRLIMCFDVYLETGENSAKEGPSEFSREKVFSRTTRGRQRAKPYKYCAELGIFTHR